MRVPVEVPTGAQENDAAFNLTSRITQIFEQKGPFRNITEDGLAAESDSSETDSDNGQDVQRDDSVENKTEEQIAKQRLELYDAIAQGTIQVNSALDFISMLLSQKSVMAQGSFSPALKQAVQPGMFDSLVLPEGQVAQNIDSLAEISKGWKSKAFATASTDLLEASKRLQNSAERESSFWSQVAVVGGKGWKASRHPRSSRVIGVHYGLAESAPQFRNRGFALLRQNADSAVYLDQTNLPRSRKRLCVDVVRNDEITGRHAPALVSSDNTTEFESQIVTARDNLLDEELFHEIGREARLAANQGIITRAEELELTIEDDLKIRLSLTGPEISPVGGAESDDDLASFIGLSARNLLLQAHDENRRRRSDPPPPIAVRAFPEPEYPILRPLIAVFRHALADKRMLNLVTTSILWPLQAAMWAGKDVDIERKSDSDNPSSESAMSQSIVSTEPQVTEYVFTLPSGKTATFKITTYLGRPSYGTSYETSEVVYSFTTFHHRRYVSVKMLQLALARLVTIDLAAFVVSTSAANVTGDSPRKWTITDPINAGLSLPRGGETKHKLSMKFKFESNTLTATVETVVPRTKQSKSLGMVWGPLGSSRPQRRIGNWSIPAFVKRESLLNVERFAVAMAREEPPR